MLSVTQLTGFGGLQPPVPTRYLYDTIVALSLTGSLNCCLDAGDPASYDGSSQQWTDRSGSGNHYMLGSTTGFDATDPVFNGSAGNSGPGTYFSFPSAGGFFTETASQAFDEGWHKNNGACTILALYAPRVGKAADSNIWGNSAGTTATISGISLRQSATGVLNFKHSITGTTHEVLASTLTTTFGSFNFIGVSFDEVTPNMKVRINGSAETIAAAASTDTAATSFSNVIGASAASTGNFRMEQDDKLVGLALWSVALSDASMASIYAEMKLRLGTP